MSADATSMKRAAAIVMIAGAVALAQPAGTPGPAPSPAPSPTPASPDADKEGVPKPSPAPRPGRGLRGGGAAKGNQPATKDPPAPATTTAAAETQEAPTPRGELVMRLGFDAPPGVVLGVDADGVAYEGDFGTGKPERTSIPWDRVAKVNGTFAGDAAAFKDVAEKAWRARARWQRGDSIAAEGLFEDLFATYAARRGATPALVAEGLLRCRMHRGAQAASVEAWLAWTNATQDLGRRAMLEDLTAAPGLSGLLDAETALSPLLPPVWVRSPAVEALGRGSAEGTEIAWAKLGKTEALSRLFAISARYESGGMPAGEANALPVKSADKGIALVARVVQARAGDADQRAKARELLKETLSQRPAAWIEAWCHVGIGRSLLRESDAEQRLLGVAELLELPARLPRAVPYLTGIALAESAVEIRRAGDIAAATKLRLALTDQFRGHPALDWDALQGWTRGAPANATPAGPSSNTPALPPASSEPASSTTPGQPSIPGGTGGG